MPTYPFGSSHPEASDEDARQGLAADESLVELRCSVLVTRVRDVLLIRRVGDASRPEHWVLPGGRPRPGEGMLACARREVAEETGLLLQPERCAFIGDVVDPNRHRRQVELVFVARLPSSHEGVLNGEAGAEPTWVSVDDIRHISLRPPIGGFLPAVISGRAPTVPYLGNLWRSQEAIS